MLLLQYLVIKIKKKNIKCMETISHSSPYEILEPTAYHSQMQTGEELRELYISKTSELISRIAGNPNKGEQPYDVVVFLDKSARPLSWMTRKLWNSLAPEEIDPQTGEKIR